MSEIPYFYFGTKDDQMIQLLPARTCIECGTKISGRVDKKFCADYCRTSYYNRLHSDQTNYVRNVNNILRKNRRILAELNTRGKMKINFGKLREKGFEFGYFTNIYRNNRGSTYHFCYEQGYLLAGELVVLVVKPEFKK